MQVIANGVKQSQPLKSCLKSASSGVAQRLATKKKSIRFSPSVVQREKVALAAKPATPIKSFTSSISIAPSQTTSYLAFAGGDENGNEEEQFDNSALADILECQTAKELDEADKSKPQTALQAKRISIFGPPVRVARKVSVLCVYMCT